MKNFIATLLTTLAAAQEEYGSVLGEAPILGGTGECSTQYYVTADKKTWDETAEECQNLGAELVTIHSQEEQEAAWTMRKSAAGRVFIGHHEHDDADGNRTWQWHDKSPMDYTNWRPGEPNNDAGKKLDCGEMGMKGGWNDVPCTWKGRGICQATVCDGALPPLHFVDPLVVVVEPYRAGPEEHSVSVRYMKQEDGTPEEMALYDHQCEEAIGHDGHYDEASGVWMLDNDYDAEPEWRCLMRPFLRYGTTRVEEAELSIEAKTVVEEKKALIAVHERLVREAEEEHKEAKCLEVVEQAIARFEECELRVLRVYSKDAESYPTSWVTFLREKRVCPDKFEVETRDCNPYFVW